MDDVVRLVGPNQAVELIGIKLVGVNLETARSCCSRSSLLPWLCSSADYCG